MKKNATFSPTATIGVNHSPESAPMETPNDPKFNPYRASPVTQLADALTSEATYVEGGRTVAAGEGLEWLTAAWKLFVAAPLMWIVIFVLYVVFFILLSFVPFIGSLIGFVLYGVIGAGWMASAKGVAQGEKLELDHMFAGAKKRTQPLLILGAAYAVGMLLISLFMIAALAIGFVGSGTLSNLMAGQLPTLSALLGALMVVMMGLALLAPLMAALWFAPALVYFHNVPPLDALKVSFFACLRNWLPFLVYGILVMMMMVIAIIPFGLGLLVAGPLVFISGYTSYRSVFAEAA